MFASSYASIDNARKAVKRVGIAFDAVTFSAQADGRVAVVAIHPVSFVWSFLAANSDLSRKAQIAALIEFGLNPNMTRTQTSRFYVTGGDKAAWNAIEKERRNA